MIIRLMIILVLSSIFFISSCKNIIHLPEHHPRYVEDSVKSKNLIDANLLPHPTDSTKVVIVYNIIESEEEGRRISDETIRASIGQFFSTIATIFALYVNDQQQ